MGVNADMLCCFPIEVKLREFDSRLHIGLELLKQGYAVLLGRKEAVHAHMFQAPGRPIYFAKSMRVRSGAFYQRIHARGGIVINLDEENYVRLDTAAENVVLSARNEEEALVQADLILLWSELQAESVRREAPGLDPEKLVVVGNARFDLRKPRYRNLYRQLPLSVPPPRGHVLICTSFGTGNSILGREAGLAKSIRRLGREHEGFLELRFSYQRLLVDYFIRALRRAAKQFPRQRFVIRPHPVERLETYSEAFTDLTNVQVTREGLAHQWIVDARVMIHHGCTTGLEALFCRKRTLAYCPILDLGHANDGMIHISEKITSEDDLMMALAALDAVDVPGDITLDGELMSVVRQLAANIDFSCAAAIGEELARRREGWFQTRPADAGGAPVPTRAASIKPLLQRAGRLLSRRKEPAGEDARRWADYRQSKLESITAEEVETMIALMRDVDTEIPAVRCRPAGPDAFWLERG